MAELAQREVIARLFLGWTFEQWALAIARVGLGGTQIRHAERCQREYKRAFGSDAPAIAFAGETPNVDLATALWEQIDGPYFEEITEERILDSSYGDQTKDDMEYDEAWQIRYGRGRV